MHTYNSQHWLIYTLIGQHWLITKFIDQQILMTKLDSSCHGFGGRRMSNETESRPDDQRVKLIQGGVLATIFVFLCFDTKVQAFK